MTDYATKYSFLLPAPARTELASSAQRILSRGTLNLFASLNHNNFIQWTIFPAPARQLGISYLIALEAALL